MKRRKFLQGLLAVTGAAAIPSAAPVSGAPDSLGRTPPAALAHCAFFDYDDNLVMAGKFTPTPAVVIPIHKAQRLSGKVAPLPVFMDAVFEREVRKAANRHGGVICYKQTSGPRMPRRGYVV